MSQTLWQRRLYRDQYKAFQRNQKQRSINAWRAFLKYAELKHQKFIHHQEFHFPPPVFDITFAKAQHIYRELSAALELETQRLHGRAYDDMTFRQLESILTYKTLGEIVDHTRIRLTRSFWSEYRKAQEQMIICPDLCLNCQKCGNKTTPEFRCESCQVQYHVHPNEQCWMFTSLSVDDCPIHKFHRDHGSRGIYHKRIQCGS